MKFKKLGKIHIEKSTFDIAELIYETREDNIALYSSHQIVRRLFPAMMEGSGLRVRSEQVLRFILSFPSTWNNIARSSG